MSYIHYLWRTSETTKKYSFIYKFVKSNKIIWLCKFLTGVTFKCNYVKVLIYFLCCLIEKYYKTNAHKGKTKKRKCLTNQDYAFLTFTLLKCSCQIWQKLLFDKHRIPFFCNSCLQSLEAVVLNTTRQMNFTAVWLWVTITDRFPFKKCFGLQIHFTWI